MKKPLSNPPTNGEMLEFLKARADHPLIQTAVNALQPGVPYTVRLQLAPIRCWKCAERIKAARGYVFGDPDIPDEHVFILLRQVSDTRQLTALVADLRKRDAAITPVGFNYSKAMKGQYFSARCPYCSMICGAFFMTSASFFPEKSCDYPDCDCSNSPNIHCKGCEYHEARLRLSADEIQDISDWIGATR